MGIVCYIMSVGNTYQTYFGMLYTLDKISDIECISRMIFPISFVPLQIIRKSFIVSFPTSPFAVSINDSVFDPGFTTPHTSKQISREAIVLAAHPLK